MWAMSSILGTVLANIPWGQVVESAPKIAQGAGRLWETVRKRADPAQTPAQGEPEGPSELQLLQALVQSQAAQLQSLEGEMRATAQLVKDLAEQNAMLVERMQTLQRQLRWALGAAALLALALAALVLS
jgi:hypothetical protein